jgi:hypothetical protein
VISIETHRLIDVFNKQFYSTLELLLPYSGSDSIVQLIENSVSLYLDISPICDAIEKTVTTSFVVFRETSSTNLIYYLLRHQKPQTLRLLLKFESFDYTVDDQKLLRKSCQKGYDQYVTILLSQQKTSVSVFSNYSYKKAKGRGFHEIATMIENHYTYRRNW